MTLSAFWTQTFDAPPWFSHSVGGFVWSMKFNDFRNSGYVGAIL